MSKRLTSFVSGLLLAWAGAALAAPPVKSGSDYSSPKQVAGTTSVSAEKAHSLWNERVKFVDPRSDSDWQAGRIPGAFHIKYNPGESGQELSASRLAQDVAKDEPVVFYCNGSGCDRSSWAAHLAQKWGWQEVYYFRGGFPAWKKAGYPVE